MGEENSIHPNFLPKHPQTIISGALCQTLQDLRYETQTTLDCHSTTNNTINMYYIAVNNALIVVVDITKIRDNKKQDNNGLPYLPKRNTDII
jgi:hypothetical protein